MAAMFNFSFAAYVWAERARRMVKTAAAWAVDCRNWRRLIGVGDMMKVGEVGSDLRVNAGFLAISARNRYPIQSFLQTWCRDFS